MSAETSIAARADAYRGWLAARAHPVPDIIAGIRHARPIALDAEGLAARGWSDLPLGWVPEDGRVHAGGYGEVRAIYDTVIFNRPGEAPREVHLGLDVFAAAGTPVFAPLSGRVHSLAENTSAKDYGPTLILEHAPQPGLVFFTLYGHLARDVLTRFAAGDTIEAGAQIAALGDETVNGGWAPHLHFQVILDMGGRSGDFPGVCARAERAHWLALCPDPRPLLGLPA